ncbi:MAG: hypothetical protein M3460_29270 [Actinomycetota bacterium]|nr:hypothetical protein [Actinomycetota bacterium]
MSTGLLVFLTVVEIVALVVVLALFVIWLTRRLRSVANALGQVSGVIRAIQGDVCLVGAGAAILNRKLNAIAGALPAIAEKAESMPLQQTQAQTSQQTQVQTSGTDWRPAVGQDPLMRRR